MQPATLRRLLVFGVCALGVAGLYLVPSAGGSPSRVSDARTDEDPQTTPQTVGQVTREPVGHAVAARGAPGPRAEGRPSPAATRSLADPATDPGGNTGEHADRRAGGAAARERGESPDRIAPSTVTDLSFPKVTAARVTIRWSPAADNVGVAGYQVLLDGFQVAETTNVEVAVPWFNDGSAQQVVQVRAVDAAGNQSSEAPAQLVQRPLPNPGRQSSGATDPSADPSATAGSTRGESDDPSEDPSEDPSDGDAVE